jgi:hypothetical protein
VTALIAKSNPLSSEETPRFVTVRWSNRRDGRPIDVGMYLKRQDYVLATEAHVNWRLVEVSGAIMKMGNGWELANPHDFQILSSASQESGTSPESPLFI